MRSNAVGVIGCPIFIAALGGTGACTVEDAEPHRARLGEVDLDHPEGLRAAQDFNVFVFEELIDIPHSQGPVAAGSLIDTRNFSFNDSTSFEHALVAGDDVLLQHGTVHGDAYYAGTRNVTPTVTLANGGAFIDTNDSADPVPFDDARLQLIARSEHLASLPTNGHAYSQWGATFLAASGDPAVINVNASLLGNAHSIILSVPDDATVVINVNGDLDLSNLGFTLNGVGPQDILWNLLNAEDVSLSGLSFPGSVLAPHADVAFDNGNFQGTLVADSVSGTGAFHWAPFDGSIEDTHVEGYVTFKPDYTRTGGGTADAIVDDLGQIPGSNRPWAPVPFLFVCAMERDSEFDESPLSAAGDEDPDDILGCAQTNRDGYFNIPTLTTQGPNLYLTTWFCSGADEIMTNRDGSVTYEDTAEVCIRMNDEDPEDARKFLRSDDSTLEFGRANYVNWNLSCPDQAGSSSGLEHVVCNAGALEPDETGGTNSAYEWNKEFVHAFRSAAETIKTFDTLKPELSPWRQAATGCGFFSDDPCEPCADDRCNDEINLFVIHAVTNSNASDDQCRVTTERGNWSTHYDNVCLQESDRGVLNPFRTVHEIGHNMHRRWMKDSSKLAQGCTGSRWDDGNNETHQTSEGYANYFAVAAWWNDDMSGMEYDGRDVLSPSDSDLVGTCGAGTTACSCAEGDLLGEGRATQFFVDIWDEGGTDISHDDILRVWSTFDREWESDECGPDGRNLQDFHERYDALQGLYGWSSQGSFEATMATNCVDMHRTTDFECDCTECEGDDIGLGFNIVRLEDDPDYSGSYTIDPQDECIIGTDGADVVISAGGGNVGVWLEDGDDEFYGTAGPDFVYGGDGDDTLFGNSGDDRLNGGDDDDTLYGGSGMDTLNGDDGEDTIFGSGDVDTIDGGDGDDTIDGGASVDVIDGGDDTDTCVADTPPDTTTSCEL
ncbi:MAG: choice-of-anchor A family protein [Myxococcota bacterium]